MLILALLGFITCQGQIVSKSDWADNAQKILRFHETHRNEKKFAEQFVLHNASLFLVYNEISEKQPDRVNEMRLALMMYLNAKLFSQYVSDHPDELKDLESVARDQLKLYGDICRQYQMRVTAIDLNDFRSSFAGHAKFRLRSL